MKSVLFIKRVVLCMKEIPIIYNRSGVEYWGVVCFHWKSSILEIKNH